MRALKCILILLLACAYANVRAQTSFNTLNLPVVIPPSPAAQNFLRYGEVPVDYSTGVPNISIPLYTVKSRQLSVPLSISYHASGIKVEDVSSPVGLGWVLNASGMIAITTPSPGSANPYHTAEALNADISAALASGLAAEITLGNNLYDYQSNSGWKSQRYNYVLPDGQSGVFRYDFVSGNVVSIPYAPVKIINYGYSIDIDIVDEKGITYSFALPSTGAEDMNTTLDLRQMVSADKTDTIRFVYKTSENVYRCPAYTTVMQLYGTPTSDGTPTGLTFVPANPIGNNPPNSASTGEHLLDSIITSNTVIKFNMTGDRQDMAFGDGKYRLTNLSVYNRSTGQQIKSYSFVQSYFGTATDNNQRLRLDSVIARGSDTARVEKYRFAYQSTVLPPYVENLNDTYGRYADDFWGYFQGSDGGGYSRYSDIPYQFVPGTFTAGTSTITIPSTYYADRSVDTTYAKACMLTEIDYPTGGKTYFSFEPNYAGNTYNFDNTSPVAGVAGGFRIKRISNYTAAGAAADYKEYTYAAGVTRPITPDLYTHLQRNLVLTTSSNGTLFNVSYSAQVFSSSPLLPLTCDNGPPVFYPSVTEYQGGASGNIGKTVYTYQPPTAFTWSDPLLDVAFYRDAQEVDRGNYVPHMLTKKVYKNASGSYQPVKATTNSYSPYLDTAKYHMGIHLNYTNYIAPIDYDRNRSEESIDGLYYSTNGFPTYESLSGEGMDFYLAHDIYATQEQDLVTQSVDYDYNPTDSTKYVATTTQYGYSDLDSYTYGSVAHLQPTQKKVSSSTGDTYITDLKYPQDFRSTAPYTTMVSENIVSPVIQQTNYKNSESTGFLNQQTTNYNAFTGYIIAPQTVQTQQGSGSAETRITYGAYDSRGNVSQVSKTNAPQVSYIWGYNQTYPIAQVTNAPVADVFYEGFEQGNGTSARGDSKTGHYSSATGISRSLSGLDNGTYILTYWSKPSGSWVLNQSTVSVTTGSYFLNLTGQLDDVRLYPVNAQMVTYTYDPDIGETSMTDSKNEVTWYEYDNFNRLKLIRDKDGNIVKTYCYNYQG